VLRAHEESVKICGERLRMAERFGCSGKFNWSLLRVASAMTLYGTKSG